jgi:hypothetical protein
MTEQATTNDGSIRASALSAGLADAVLELRYQTDCGATNANKDLASAQEEMQDKRLSIVRRLKW